MTEKAKIPAAQNTIDDPPEYSKATPSKNWLGGPQNGNETPSEAESLKGIGSDRGEAGIGTGGLAQGGRMAVGLAAQNENLTKRLQSLRERITTSNSEDTSETVGDLSHNVLNIFAVCGELMYVADPQKGNDAQQALENAPNDMKTGDLLNQIFNIYAP
jgi:hypothetical protein